ncbi:YwmB family TATA-box binding protein [Senegalia massiliensis]|uniref:TATA-box binding protein n=1 Tax=Senegalia massiliensis TaxID=1720316 RepID=A0A845QY12_9CLOT|nr:YwmB family TATA-box binding protein [Senegalia massiliensis]NBI06028.1 hypothetical protein [Senegalia massiliensis]
MDGKRLIITIILIFILALSNYTVSASIRNNLEQPIVTAFNNINANLIEISIKAQGTINEEFMSEKDIKKLGQDFKNKFNIIGELESNNNIKQLNSTKKLYSLEYIESENNKKIIVSGVDKNNRFVTINVLTYKDKYSNLNRTDLIVNIISQNVNNYKKIESNVQKIFEEYNTTPNITSKVIGTFEGNIKTEEKFNIISHITKTVDARIVEEYKNPDILSISAYSPNIDNHIYTGKNKMNLNIAMRHNYTEDKTYIFIATPIIDGGY